MSLGESYGSAEKAGETRCHRVRLIPVCKFSYNLPRVLFRRIDLDQ